MISSGFVQNGTANLYYELDGAGEETVVLVMGTGGSHLAWTPQTRFFIEKGFRVLVFDNRGTGKTEFDLESNDLKLGDMASDVEKLRSELDLGKIHVIGMSLGSAISAQYAHDFPGNIKSLQMHVPFARVNESVSKLVDKFTADVIPGLYTGVSVNMGWAKYNLEIAPYIFPEYYYNNEKGVQKLLKNTENDPLPTSARGLIAHWKLDQSLDLEPVLNVLPKSIPKLVSVARHDKLVPKDLGIEFYEMIKCQSESEIRFYEFEDGYHLINFTNLTEFNDLCLNFIESSK